MNEPLFTTKQWVIFGVTLVSLLVLFVVGASVAQQREEEATQRGTELTGEDWMRILGECDTKDWSDEQDRWVETDCHW